MILVFLPLISSITYVFPQYSLMNVNNPICPQLKEEVESILDEIKSQCSKSKEGDEIYEYCQIYGPLQGIFCTSSSNINNDLSNIPKSTAVLIIEAPGGVTLSLDLSHLSTSSDVILSAGASSRQTSNYLLKKFERYSFDNVIKAISKITNKKLILHSNNQNLKNTKASNAKIDLAGNIGSKVNSLTILSSSSTVKITDADLNVDNFYLFASTLDDTSKSIKSKRLGFDGVTHANNIEKNKELIKVAIWNQLR